MRFGRALGLGLLVGASLVVTERGAALDHSACVRPDVWTWAISDCLHGDGGALTDVERDALLTQLRTAAAASPASVEQELLQSVLVPDPVSRAVVAELLVAHGLVTGGAAGLITGLGDPTAELAAALHDRNRRVRRLTPMNCHLVLAETTDTRLRIDCDDVVGCRGCLETHAAASLSITATRWRVSSAWIADSPPLDHGHCGECRDLPF